MAGNCRELDCRESSEFVCGCNPEVRLCSTHMVTHVRQPGDHRLILLSDAMESLKNKANEEVIKLDTRISEAYDHGKGMVQEILDKVNAISNDMTRRQKDLIELASSGRLGPDIDRGIMDLSSVTLSLSRNQAFRRAIDRHFSLEDGDQEEAFFRGELDVLANHMNESNAILLRLLEKNHIENSEIIRKVRNLESGTGLQATVEQMRKAFDQSQSENNEMKLKIHALEKETQDCRKDIAENKILSVSLKSETITDIQALKREINDFRRISDSIMQENQKSKAELERRIDTLPSSDIFARIPKENDELKRKVAGIEKQIVEVQNQMKESLALVEKNKIELEIRAKREKEERDKAEAERLEREEAERIRKLDEARVARNAIEKENSKPIYAQTLALEKEYKDLLAQIQGQLQQVKPKNVIQQSELDSIFNSDPNYIPKPNEIQSEVKAIYTTIRDNIRILSDSNIELQNIINSAAPAGEIATFNNDLKSTTIPQLENSKESCKSFVAFMTERVICLIVTNGGSYTYQSIKISNDRNYYFFCKL